jgi:hypothetical protein
VPSSKVGRLNVIKLSVFYKLKLKKVSLQDIKSNYKTIATAGFASTQEQITQKNSKRDHK